MFYAHFVLTKKGPLARIWLAAHWDKKLTKAHVFETNIDSSVEAIMKPKVKLALRTSGHLLLGVVRIYSRKAKYLLADCNEAFVKIKMAFRPGVVDLPEENREAAVAAITLQENFHDFDALDDLNDLDVNAQFSTVNQSRPEEITMKEDLTTISFVGDDNFGDVGFDERELIRDAAFDNAYSPRPEISIQQVHEKSDTMLPEHSATAQAMDVDLPPPMMDDGFGGGFMAMGNNDDDDDDADSFGGGVDQDFLDDDLLAGGNLFEDTPAVQEPVAAAAPPQQDEVRTEVPPVTQVETSIPPTPAPGTSGEQTTLITNENEAFALEPLDTTHMPGIERRKRKRKLIVDEQQGIPSETMKMQLSDTGDILTTLDLAPPTKKLMHWKETGGFEKLFALPGRAISSKAITKMFKRNLKTRPSEELEADEERLELDSTEINRDEDLSISNKSRTALTTISTIREEISTIVEEPSMLETSKRSRTSDPSLNETPLPPAPKTPGNSSVAEQNVSDIFGTSVTEPHIDIPEVPSLINPHFEEDGPPSIAPFSVGPASVGPASVGPGSVGGLAFGEDVEGGEQMPENVEEEEKRWTKRTEQMQHILDTGFKFTDELSFKDMARKLNRKQVTSKFYTLLVLKKQQIVTVSQSEPFGDILMGKGPRFGMAC